MKLIEKEFKSFNLVPRKNLSAAEKTKIIKNIREYKGSLLVDMTSKFIVARKLELFVEVLSFCYPSYLLSFSIQDKVET